MSYFVGLSPIDDALADRINVALAGTGAVLVRRHSAGEGARYWFTGGTPRDVECALAYAGVCLPGETWEDLRVIRERCTRDALRRNG